MIFVSARPTLFNVVVFLGPSYFRQWWVIFLSVSASGWLVFFSSNGTFRAVVIFCTESVQWVLSLALHLSVPPLLAPAAVDTCDSTEMLSCGTVVVFFCFFCYGDQRKLGGFPGLWDHHKFLFNFSIFFLFSNYSTSQLFQVLRR